MNCCKKKNDDNRNKHKRHMFHMILCCGLPLLIIFVLPLLGYKGFLTSIAPFICPIMMLIMIPMMMRGNGDSCHNNSNPTETKSIEEKQQ